MDDRPKYLIVVNSKWVFKQTYYADSTIWCFKTRLVAHGFTQNVGTARDDIFSEVVRINSLRVLIALAELHDFYIHKMEVTTTFLNGTLEEIKSFETLEGYNQPRDEDKVGLVF